MEQEIIAWHSSRWTDRHDFLNNPLQDRKRLDLEYYSASVGGMEPLVRQIMQWMHLQSACMIECLTLCPELVLVNTHDFASASITTYIIIIQCANIFSPW
mmetsp:Transcript_5870/g.22273  ORF Transcript_5870/g.22273 Transcript_5870/m.22273 type:complete len:100 (+) Transcript_5870:387-686(+)